MKTKEEIEKQIALYEKEQKHLNDSINREMGKLDYCSSTLVSLKSELAAITDNKSERWKPGAGEYYHYLGAGNDINTSFYRNDTIDNVRYNAFNMFQTEEEAQKEAATTLVWRELRQFAKEWNNEQKDTFLINKFYGVNLVGSYPITAKALTEKFGDRLKLLNFDNL